MIDVKASLLAVLVLLSASSIATAQCYRACAVSPTCQSQIPNSCHPMGTVFSYPSQTFAAPSACTSGCVNSSNYGSVNYYDGSQNTYDAWGRLVHVRATNTNGFASINRVANKSGYDQCVSDCRPTVPDNCDVQEYCDTLCRTGLAICVEKPADPPLPPPTNFILHSDFNPANKSSYDQCVSDCRPTVPSNCNVQEYCDTLCRTGLAICVEEPTGPPPPPTFIFHSGFNPANKFGYDQCVSDCRPTVPSNCNVQEYCDTLCRTGLAICVEEPTGPPPPPTFIFHPWLPAQQ